jgi:hypothetical protein
MIDSFTLNSGLRLDMPSCSDSAINYFKSISLIIVKFSCTQLKKQSFSQAKEVKRPMKHFLMYFNLSKTKWPEESNTQKKS